MNTPNANICRHGIWHLAVLCAVQLLLTGVGGAQTTTWNNPGTGSWFIPGNWSNGVPTFNTDFLIRNGGTAQVLGGGFANSSSPYLGLLAGESGNLVVSDSGSTWNYAYSFFVGEAGTGKLSIQGGGVVSGSPGYAAFIGRIAGSNGTVLVDGIGSTWTHHGLIYVGADGTGELTIQNGGVVSESDPFTNTYIGYAASSRGTALVSGAGSIWNNSGGLVVGYQGTGLLTIRDGATVSSAGATIGFDGGSLGTVLVEGNGSTWNCAHQLSIASYGTGRLTIQDGGTVNVNGGTGTVELTTIPPGTGTLDIGAFGGGTRAGTLHAAIVNGGLGTAVVNFNQTDTITFAPRITGSTSVNQLGSGATILSGTHTYTGATTVSGGTLFVDGSIAGNTFVNPGGTLGGRGRILGNVGNSGVISPGHSPGTLSIGGDYTQQSDGALRITVAGTQPGQFSALAVGGKANLAGTLQIVTDGGATLKLGDRLAIVTAVGGVTGAFSTIVNPFATGTMLGTTVLYEANAVLLAFTQSSYLQFAILAGLSQNQTAIAQAIDLVASDPRAAQAMAFLNSEPESNIPEDLSRLGPEELTSIFNLSTSLANIQSANIQRRLADIRGTTPVSSTIWDAADAIAEGPKPASAKPHPLTDGERWGIWMTGTGEFTHVGSTTNAAGFSLDSGGVTAGADYRFTDHFAAGISIGYMNTTAGIANGGKVDVDGGRVGGYATWFDRGLHLDFAVSGGPNSYATRRITPNNTTATGSPEGTEVNLLFAAGYDWNWQGVTLGPIASLQYTNVQLNGFTERGAFAPLDVSAQNTDSLRSALGFHATFERKIGRAILRPEVRAAWQHEFGATSYSLTSSFATLGGSAFTVTGPATGRDSLLLSAGFNILWNGRFSTYAFYDSELLRTNFTSNNISVGCRYRF